MKYIKENNDNVDKYREWLNKRDLAGEEPVEDTKPIVRGNFNDQQIWDFWDFVELADWNSDHDYNRIKEWFRVTYGKPDRDLMKAIFNNMASSLDVRFEEDWLGDPGIDVSDDGWSDLKAEVVGRGQDFYNNITVEKLQEMANNRDYHESFRYSFH